VQQGAQQQTRRTGTNNGHLCTACAHSFKRRDVGS
jgi:hypothetical protein